MAPSLAADPMAVDWLTRMMPASADPRTVVASTRLTYATDVRAALPTNVLSVARASRGEATSCAPSTRLRGSRTTSRAHVLMPLDGEDHPFWAADTSVLLGELEAFVRGLGP